MSVFLSSFPRPISVLTPFDVEQGAQHTPAGCGSQDCSHASSSIWINWRTMNKSHVIKEYMHKIGVRNACHVTEAVQSWGFVLPPAGDQLVTLPLDCIRDLPPRLADLALQPPRIYNAVLCTFMCYKFGAPYNVWNLAWWRHLWGRWNFKGLSAPTHGIGLSKKFHSLLNMLIPSVLWQCWLDVPMHEGQKDLFYCCCWCIFYA